MDKYKISISRGTDSKGNSSITVQLEDPEYKTIFRGEMSLEDFAKTITGFACQPIERDM